MVSDAQERIKVLVIDTGVDTSHKEIKSHVKEPWDLNYLDDNGHGTAIAGLILKETCNQIELVSCRYYFPWDRNYIEPSNNCFRRALNENINYINYSSTGEESNEKEKELIKSLTDKGVIITVAAGNQSKNLTQTGECKGAFPACYLFPNLFVVQNIDKNEKLDYRSNYLTHPNARSEMGVDVPVLLPKNQVGKLTGTSISAAKYMNSLLLKRCWELNK